MPKWTTKQDHWGTAISDCNRSLRNTILNAYNDFINNPCLDPFGSLRGVLKLKWPNVEIACTGQICIGRDGAKRGNKIWICDHDPKRVPPVLLHELVHLCNGTELDSEAAEYAYFDPTKFKVTPPSQGDWRIFLTGTSPLYGNRKERVGRYVIWNSDTGEVWKKDEEQGGPAGIIKGVRIFQLDSWIRTYHIVNY